MKNSITTLNDDEKKLLRDKVLELTGYDIDKSVASTGSRNINYVISESTKPAAIRISPCERITSDEMHSELLFIDYLKEFISTICQPVPMNNNLINKVSVGDKDFYVVVFRKGNGWFEHDSGNEVYKKLAATLLGKIHHASVLANKEGFKYKRDDWDKIDRFQINREMLSSILDEKTIDDMQKTIDDIKKLPKSPETYGMIHGDFGNHNMFIDWDDAWVFDFDDSCYAPYILDMCSILVSDYMRCLMMKTPEKFDSMVAEFRKDYEKENILPDDQWSHDNIMKFIRLRMIVCINVLTSTSSNDSPQYTQFLPMLINSFKASMANEPA